MAFNPGSINWFLLSLFTLLISGTKAKVLRLKLYAFTVVIASFAAELLCGV